MKVIPTPLRSESAAPDMYLIVVHDLKAQPSYFAARKYLSIEPELYIGPKPKRSLSIGQTAQFMYKRYPTLFEVVDVFESKLGDTLVVLKFNMGGVENLNDINYLG
jgi:hypothetical protein